MVELPTLGGHDSEAAAVNAGGQVVGESITAANSFHAFSWTEKGGMIDLGTLGGASSFAVAVNAGGQVVGASTTLGDAQLHATLWP
jgi:probable HAF family extracellular repeat protein